MSLAHIIKSDNFTELYKKVQYTLIQEGQKSSPRNMPTHELMNATLILTNPRERLLYSHVRKHNYTYASAEFLWYSKGVNDLESIAFYLKRMRDFSDDGLTLNSAYGYRIFGKHPDFPNQWRNVLHKLIEDRDTRQGVITIHYQKDIDQPSKDVPCTLNMHFMIRDNKLHLMVQMRSNDAYMGLIYDTFAFTLFQEEMYNQLCMSRKFKDLELGPYIHKADSLHIYDRDLEGAEKLLNEPLSDVVDLIDDNKDLHLDGEQLSYLTTDEELLRCHSIKIAVDNYTGVCRFMAVKLNKILDKKQ